MDGLKKTLQKLFEGCLYTKALQPDSNQLSRLLPIQTKRANILLYKINYVHLYRVNRNTKINFGKNRNVPDQSEKKRNTLQRGFIKQYPIPKG